MLMKKPWLMLIEETSINVDKKIIFTYVIINGGWK